MSDSMQAFKKANEQIKKEGEKEAQKLRFDFDQAIAEVEQDELEISFNGQIYTLPSDCPAPLLLKILDNPDDPTIISKLVGSQLSDAIKDADEVPMKALTKLIEFIKDAWGIKSADQAKNNLTPDS